MRTVLKDLFLNGGASFSPSTLNPLMWFDSTGMASDGSLWEDNMGTYDVTAAGGARPTYTTNQINGLPCFVFDGTSDVLNRARVNSMQGISGITIWAVMKNGVLSHDEGAGASFRTALLQNAGSGNDLFPILSNGGLQYASYNFTNNFNYSVMVFDGSLTGNANRLKLWVNGVQQTLSFVGTIPSTTENNASSTFQIGQSAATKYSGSIAECGVVAYSLTSEEIIKLNTYLALRYGL